MGILDLGFNKQAVEKYLTDPDQEKIRTELATFFGPRAESFLAIYDRMRESSGNRRMWPLSWNWVAFFFGFPWFFYRRLYIWGAVLILVPLVLGLLFPSASGGGMAVTGIFAKPLYVHIGLSRITKADALGLTGAERKEYLRRAGGVSLVAGLFAALLFTALFALAILSIVAEKHGAP